MAELTHTGTSAAWSADDYYAARYRHNAQRDRIWQHITDYLRQYWQLPTDGHVLELGCGYGSWIKSVTASKKHALDVHPDVARILRETGAADVTAHVGSCTDLSGLSLPPLDLVLASNLLEHLVVDDVLQTLREVHRVLRPGGQICIVQPNFALCPRQYFDDFTHKSIFTDRSLRDVLTVAGLDVQYVWRRFLPFSMNPATSRLSFLVPLYLRSPWKPLAGQMCLIAGKPPLHHGSAEPNDVV